MREGSGFGVQQWRGASFNGLEGYSMTRWRALPRYSLRWLLVCFMMLTAIIAVYREPLRRQIESWIGTRRAPVNHVVIYGPQTQGVPVALDPPSPAEINEALASLGTAKNLLDGSTMVITPVADFVDPPKFSSSTGTFQLHHAHYLCRITSASGTRTVVVDHLHRCIP